MTPEQFDNLTIGKLKEITEDYERLRIVETQHQRLRESVKVYQGDIKARKEQQTAQEIINWAGEKE